MQEANLYKGVFERIDLQEAHLEGTNLQSSDWRDSDLRNIQLNNAKVRSAICSINVRMEGANWWSANFFGAQKNVNEEQIIGFFKQSNYQFPKDSELTEVHKSARDFIENLKPVVDRDRLRKSGDLK